MFSAYFTAILRVCKASKILGVFEVFLGTFEMTKEKKERGVSAKFCGFLRLSAKFCGFCEYLRLQHDVAPSKRKNLQTQVKNADLAPFVPFSLSLLVPLQLVLQVNRSERVSQPSM